MQQSSDPSRGFTIIEVVLFLAITGLMMAGILAAVGAGVNGKRYTEAVDSFQDFLISQYDQTDNVANTHEATIGCNGATPRPAGTSNCSVIGRLVTSQDGLNIKASPLYAGADVSAIDSQDIDSPAELLESLNIYTVSDNPDAQQYQMRWQTRLTNQNGAAVQPFSLMIVRLPYAKGSINYISDRAIASDAPENISQFITQVNSVGVKKQLALCVDPAGLQSAPPVGLLIENGGSGGSSSMQRKGDICQ